MSWSPGSVNTVLQKSTVGYQKPPEFLKSLELRIFCTWKCCQKFRWNRRGRMWSTRGDQPSWFVLDWGGSQDAWMSVLHPGESQANGDQWVTLCIVWVTSSPSVCVVYRVVSALVSHSPDPSPAAAAFGCGLTRTLSSSLIITAGKWKQSLAWGELGEISAPAVTGTCLWQHSECSELHKKRKLYLPQGLSWSPSEIMCVEVFIKLLIINSYLLFIYTQ